MICHCRVNYYYSIFVFEHINNIFNIFYLFSTSDITSINTIK